VSAPLISVHGYTLGEVVPSLGYVNVLASSSQINPRLIDLQDIAALAVFLASDAAKSISGQVIPIDYDRQMT